MFVARFASGRLDMLGSAAGSNTAAVEDRDSDFGQLAFDTFTSALLRSPLKTRATAGANAWVWGGIGLP